MCNFITWLRFFFDVIYNYTNICTWVSAIDTLNRWFITAGKGGNFIYPMMHRFLLYYQASERTWSYQFNRNATVEQRWKATCDADKTFCTFAVSFTAGHILASHAGVFRGACFSSTKDELPWKRLRGRLGIYSFHLFIYLFICHL